MSPEQRVQAAGTAPELRNITDELTAALDDLHESGIAVPEAVKEAVKVLTALGAALAANGSGQPAPGWARSALGLDTRPARSYTVVPTSSAQRVRQMNLPG